MNLVWAILLVVATSWYAYYRGARYGATEIIMRMKALGWTLTPPGKDKE